LDTAFLATLWGSLGTTYDVHLKDNLRRLSWAHWKARGGLPISVN